MAPVYLYGLIDPRSGLVRYVGKSRRPKERLVDHLAPSNLHLDTYKARWLRKLVALGLRPRLVILEVSDEEHWPALECRLIAAYLARGYNLTNSTMGGDACNAWLPAVREKIGAAHRGRPSPLKGRPNGKSGLPGHPSTPAARAKQSASRKAYFARLRAARAAEPPAPAKPRKTCKGRPQTPEHIARRAAALRGRRLGPLSPETKAKISAATKGKPKSPETRARMIASRRERAARERAARAERNSE